MSLLPRKIRELSRAKLYGATLVLALFVGFIGGMIVWFSYGYDGSTAGVVVGGALVALPAASLVAATVGFFMPGRRLAEIAFLVPTVTASVIALLGCVVVTIVQLFPSFFR